MQNKNIMDLFAGCGGMSLGFELAGFKSLVAVEKDDWASETYAYNHPGTKVFTGDITQIKDPGEAFPDSYIFKGKRTTMSWEKSLSQYQQIGNAVPPLLAKALAVMIEFYFDNIHSCKNVIPHKPVEQLTLPF